MKSLKYFLNLSPDVVNPAEVDKPAPAPIKIFLILILKKKIDLYLFGYMILKFQKIIKIIKI